MNPLEKGKSRFSLLSMKSAGSFKDLLPNPSKNIQKMDTQELEAAESFVATTVLSHLVVRASGDPKQLIRYYLRSDYRTDDEASQLLDQLKNYKLFRQFLHNTEDKEEREPLIYVCKRLKYERISEGRTVVKQGETSDGRVYMVLSGELSVYVKEAHFVGDGVNIKIIKDTSDQKEMTFSALSEHVMNTPKLDSRGTPHLSRRDSFRNRAAVTKLRQMSAFVTAIQSSPTHKDHEHKDNPMRLSVNFASDVPKIKNLNAGFLDLAKTSSKDSQFLNVASESDGSSSPESARSKSPIPNPSPQLSAFANKGSTIFGNNTGSRDSFVIKETAYGVLKDKIIEGGFFGERAPQGHRRKATVVANTDVELLWMTGDDYRYIQNKFDKTKLEYISYVKQCFGLPEKQDAHLLDAITYIMELRDHGFNETIITQGSKGEDFFLIFDGSCELKREVIYDTSQDLNFDSNHLTKLYRMKKTTKQEISVSNINRGSFFGLETLNGARHYQYTVKVTSSRVKLIAFNTSKTQVRFPASSIQALRQLQEDMEAERLLTVQRRLEATRGCDPEAVSLNPTVMLPRRKAYSKTIVPTSPSASSFRPKIDLNFQQDFPLENAFSVPQSTRKSSAININFAPITPVKPDRGISFPKKSGSMPHINPGFVTPASPTHSLFREVVTPKATISRERTQNFSRSPKGSKSPSPEQELILPKTAYEHLRDSKMSFPTPFRSKDPEKIESNVKYSQTVSMRKATQMNDDYKHFLDVMKDKFKFINEETKKPATAEDIRKYKLGLDLAKYFKHKPKQKRKNDFYSKDAHTDSKPQSPHGHLKELDLADCMSAKIKKIKPHKKYQSVDFNIQAFSTMRTGTGDTVETKAEYFDTPGTSSPMSRTPYDTRYSSFTPVSPMFATATKNLGKTQGSFLKKTASMSTIKPSQSIAELDGKKGKRILSPRENIAFRTTTAYHSTRLQNLVAKAQKVI